VKRSSLALGTLGCSFDAVEQLVLWGELGHLGCST